MKNLTIRGVWFLETLGPAFSSQERSFCSSFDGFWASGLNKHATSVCFRRGMYWSADFNR